MTASQPHLITKYPVSRIEPLVESFTEIVDPSAANSWVLYLGKTLTPQRFKADLIQ